MIDTIKCESELDLTEAFYEKLLLGAIDKRLDHTKIETHHPAKDDQETTIAPPYRPKTIGKGKERRWSDEEIVVASSSRWDSYANRSSTMQTLYESSTGDARPASTFGERPLNLATSRHASPPSAGFPPPTRHTTFHNTIQERDEPEPRAAQRSNTSGSHRSSWWKPHAS